MSVSVDVRLDRASKTFQPGDTVTGRVVVTSKTALKHEGVDLSLEGQVATQKGTSGLDNYITTSKPCTLLSHTESLARGGKLTGGTTELPFSIQLRPTPGQSLVETYHGLHISATYTFRCELKKSLLQQNVVTTEEVFIEIPEKTTDKAEKAKKTVFEFNNTTVGTTMKEAKLEIPEFSVKGEIDSLVCPLSLPLTGHLLVERSQVAISSLEVSLQRVETCQDLSQPRTSEILSLQLGEGDVTRGLAIPLHLIFPRFFVCTSTSSSLFSLAFHLTLSVVFANNVTVSETFDIVTKRTHT